MICVDTLRSDRLPAYGYREIETPRLEELVEDAILFERAYANYPLTLPSHASIFSGRLPSEHGVRDNVGYAVETDPTWLPRWLRDRGWSTGAAISAWILRRETGIGEGFSFYEDSIAFTAGGGVGDSQRPGSETVDRALRWLREQEAGSKYFLFVHLYEPHAPWEAPEPFRSRVSDPYDGEVVASDAL
ncbi:MAG: sulfatase-like hydrolase/transferase, partial [Thermoanaerobaculia bacterium]|nr:sulfatase-like hydrolase/transferase [Thermoanaerobaculia bacterium]